MEEKYRLCDETLSKLLEWIAVVEERLANQEAVKEDMDELRNQINILKVRILMNLTKYCGGKIRNNVLGIFKNLHLFIDISIN